DEPVREPGDLTLVARAPGTITRCDAREVLAAAPCIRDQLGERGDVAQREIESLARDRMQRHRGVTDEDDAPVTERVAPQSTQGVQRAPPDLENASEAIAERVLQRLAKRVVRQRRDALGFTRRQRPYDADAASGKRQHRKRTALQEPLV